jgi:type VI secretion system protein ImpK
MPAVAETTSAVPSRRRPRSSSDLISLAAPLIDLVLKIKAEIVPPSSDLRPAVQSLFQEIEQRGATLRYPERQLKAAKFALAAFIDETVLSVHSPLREEWEKFPLQLEYFGEHLGGVSFFERLDELMKEIKTEADVVEVYYVCMLLGFKGKYKVYMEDQLQQVIKNTADQLKRAGRLQQMELSPHWRVADQPKLPEKPGIPLWLKISAGSVFVLALIIYLAIWVFLKSEVRSATEQLLR